MFLAELRAAEVYPIFQKKEKLICGVKNKRYSHNHTLNAVHNMLFG